MEMFCGDLTYNVPMEFSLQRITGIYGDINLFCKWTAINQSGIRQISVNYTIYDNNENFSLVYEVYFHDGRPSVYFQLLNSTEIILNNVDQICFYFYTQNTFNELPFIIAVDNQIKKNSIIIAATVCVIAMIGSLCIILCCKIAKDNTQFSQQRRRNRRAQSQTEVTERELEVIDSPEILKKKNMDLLENLLKTELTGKNYKKELNVFKTNCTVCLEEFNSKNIVCVLECKHIFHFDCLRDWLIKNIMKPICPNCNYNVFIKNETKCDVNNYINQNSNNLPRPNRNNLPLLDSPTDFQQINNNINNNSSQNSRQIENGMIDYQSHHSIDPEIVIVLPIVNHNSESSRSEMNNEISPLKIKSEIKV